MQPTKAHYFYARYYGRIFWVWVSGWTCAAPSIYLWILLHHLRLPVLSEDDWISAGLAIMGFLWGIISGTTILGTIYQRRVRKNGGPFRIGDAVRILKGPLRDCVGNVVGIDQGDRYEVKVESGQRRYYGIEVCRAAWPGVVEGRGALLNYDSRPPSRLARVTSKWAQRSRRVLPFAAVLFLLYVGSYIVLSIYGRYEPASIDPRGVQGYEWAPVGFVDNYRPRRSLFIFYLPLWAIDRNFWHRYDDWSSGKHPIHVPANDDDVRRVWEALQ